jgi:multiple antibiotic resistance protein
MMLLVVAAALVVMLLASPLNRLLGMAGAAIISRVMGMMLAAVAVDNVLEAFTKLGVLPPI